MKCNKNFLTLLFSSLIIISITLFAFLQNFPTATQKLGHDYAFLPTYFENAIWILKNGFFEVPWFTPSFCAGIPRFADPQSDYFSIHNILIFLMGPLSGLVLFFILCSSIGFFSTYFLSTRVFKLSIWSSLLGASLFTLNHFFITRMWIGHSLFAYYMFIPLLLLTLLTPQKRAISIVLTALLLAMLNFAGSVFIIIIFILIAVSIILLLQLINQSSLRESLIRLVSSLFLAGLYSSSKLIASSAYYAHFKKDFYEIPGLSSLWSAIILPFKLMIFPSPSELLSSDWINLRWAIQEHELSYQIGPVPFFIIVAMTLFLLISKKWSIKLPNIKTTLTLIPLTLTLFLPILFSLHIDSLYPLYKKIPVVNQLMAPPRWYLIYLPIIIFVAAYLMDKLSERLKKITFVVGALVTVILYFSFDRTFYANQKYDPSPTIKNFNKLDMLKDSFAIKNILIPAEYAENEMLTSLSKLPPNEVSLFGFSSTRCYSPIFGYRLELLPTFSLKTGDIFFEESGYLNINNPACYLYPKENKCKPGDRFKVSEKEKAQKFASFKPFDFEMPLKQKVANILSPLLILLSLIYLGYLLSKNANRRK